MPVTARWVSIFRWSLGLSVGASLRLWLVVYFNSSSSVHRFFSRSGLFVRSSGTDLLDASQAVQAHFRFVDDVIIRWPMMTQAGLSKFGDFKKGVDVEGEVESVWPDAIVSQDDVILQDP